MNDPCQSAATADIRSNGHIGEHTWAEYDARGIYLCRVCEHCEEAKLSRYRRDVLEDSNYECDEPIDPDY